MQRRPYTQMAVVGLAIVALGVAPLFVNQGLLFLLGFAMLQSIFAMSWNLMFSYGGIASFGHAMFYGTGAYTVAAMLYHLVPVPFVFMVLAAVVIGATCAFLVGLVVLRRTTGIQLAVLTLALSQFVLLIVSYTTYLGRDDGLSGLMRPKINLLVAQLDLSSLEAFYYFILVSSVAVIGALLWFLSGRHGRTLLSVRIDSERAAFLGINVFRQKLAAFTLAGAIAAFAGALAAPWSQIVSTETMSWLQSAQPMLATLLGGTGSFWGPVIGSFSLIGVNYLTRSFAGVSEVIVGAVLLLIVIVAPSGIAGLAALISRKMKTYSR